MKRGFSLAETAVSLAVVSLILLFVLNLFPSALVAQKGAEERLQANSLARSLLEQQLDTPFAQLPVGLHRTLDPVEKDGVTYAMRLEVEDSPQADDKFLRVLRLVVRWQARGRQHQIQRQLFVHRLAHQQNR